MNETRFTQTSVLPPVLTLSTVNSKLFYIYDFIFHKLFVIILFYSPLFYCQAPLNVGWRGA